MKPHTLYLEEVHTNNAEFPEDGKFKLKDDVLYTHYIVCGDRESAPSATEFTASLQPGPSNPSASIAESGLFLALSVTYKRAH